MASNLTRPELGGTPWSMCAVPRSPLLTRHYGAGPHAPQPVVGAGAPAFPAAGRRPDDRRGARSEPPADDRRRRLRGAALALEGRRRAVSPAPPRGFFGRALGPAGENRRRRAGGVRTRRPDRRQRPAGSAAGARPGPGIAPRARADSARARTAGCARRAGHAAG